MFSEKEKLVKIAEDRSVLFALMGERDIVPILIDGQSCLLIWYDESFYVVKNKCPHQGIKLTSGKCEDGKIICPWHHYAFDLKTGKGAGLHLENYPVTENDSGIFVKMKFFSWF